MYVIKALQAPYRKAPARHPFFRRQIPTQNRRKFLRRFYVGFFRRFATLNADDTKTGKTPHSIERFYGTDRQNENANYNPLSISRFSIFCDFAKQKRSSTSRFRFRCDARNRNHRETHESKHSRPIEKQTELAIRKPRASPNGKPRRKRMAGTTYAMPAS